MSPVRNRRFRWPRALTAYKTERDLEGAAAFELATSRRGSTSSSCFRPSARQCGSPRSDAEPRQGIVEPLAISDPANLGRASERHISDHPRDLTRSGSRRTSSGSTCRGGGARRAAREGRKREKKGGPARCRVPVARQARQERSVIERVCVVGAGAIGSLFAGHLAQGGRSASYAPARARGRAERAEGLRVTAAATCMHGQRRGQIPASPAAEPLIIATKATGLEAAAGPARAVPRSHGDDRAERARRGGGRPPHGDWPIVSAVTFMSGTKHSDTHVEYILDTATWVGPYEDTPLRHVARSPADRASWPERRGAARPAVGPVVEADLQRDRELRRRA